MFSGRWLIATGAVFAGIGVAAGAFGAHGLRSLLAPDMLAVYETAVRYQMYHAFGLIVAGIVAHFHPSRLLRMAGWMFVLGILIFSGSLFLLILANIRWLGALTPVGGLCFIAGWVLLTAGVIRQKINA